METKIFKILLDGELTNTIPISNDISIGTIKEYFNQYLSGLGKDSSDYYIKIYLDNVDKLDVDNTTRYDNMNLDSVWNKITDGYIVLSHNSNYFRRLYTDAIFQIALKLDLNDLASLCRADKRMNRICNDDNFWLMRLNNDYGIMVNPDKESWKEFYKGVKKYDKKYGVLVSSNEDLINYGKYITKLNLNKNKTVTDEGLKYVPNLIELELIKNKNITDEGLKYVPNLTYLNLQYSKNITDEGLKYVPNLDYLTLWDNEKITDEGLKYVPNLTSFYLRRNEKITDEGLKYLPNLTALNLAYNEKITDEGLKHVPNLTYLNLTYNRMITDEGLKYVPDLTYLKMFRNENITGRGLAYIPNAKIDAKRN